MEMRLVLFLVLFIAMFSFSGQGSRALDFELTPSQKHFTAIVKGLPGVLRAEWKSPVTLLVRISSKALGYPPDPAIAKELADVLADRGRTAMRQPFCIHIMDGKNRRLARSCAYE